MAVTTRNSKASIAGWLPLIGWLCFVFFMSTAGFSSDNTFPVLAAMLHALFPDLSINRIDTMHTVVRKMAHVFEYFILGLLLLRAFRSGSKNKWTWKWSVLSVLGILVWAVSDEYHQSFVSTRMASLRDVAIDTTGGLLGQFASALWYRYGQR